MTTSDPVRDRALPASGALPGDRRRRSRLGGGLVVGGAAAASKAGLVVKLGVVAIKVKQLVVVGSLAASYLTYALLFGWSFAAGFLGLLVVHEAGHVLAARARGVPVSLPTFVPLLGAFVRVPGALPPPDAVVVAAGGPFLGGVGAFAVLGLALASGSSLLWVLASVGFALNLFNLLPLHPLDGGRILAVVHPGVSAVGVVVGLAVEVVRPSALLGLLVVVAAVDVVRRWRAGTPRPVVAASVRWGAALGYAAGVVALLSGMAWAAGHLPSR